MMMRQILRSDAVQTNYARLADEVARRIRFRCAECNSADRMVSWDWHNLAETRPGELPVMFYRRPEDHKHLYEACQHCNETVPTGYVLLTDEEVAAAVRDAQDRAVYDLFGMD